MKKTSLLAAAGLLWTLMLAPTVVLAVEEGPESALPFNASLVTEYRYRGISQSRLQPAVQGGVDYTNPNGFYVGTWASTIKWIKDAGNLPTTTPHVNTGSTDFEWDFYGGYKFEVAKDLTLDLGGLYYLYAGNKYVNVPGSVNANTFELYAAISIGAFTTKYSLSTTNLFGFANSKGSGYLDLTYTADLGDGLSLAPHYGRQDVRHNGISSYNDFALTLGKDFGKGFNLSATLLGTDANKAAYVSPAGKALGKSTVTAMLKYNF